MYFRNERNQERAYSRNKGVELAKNEFIFFLDCDDLWKEDYIENSLPYLQEGYHIVYSIPRDFVDDEGRHIRRSQKPVPLEPAQAIFNSLVGYPSATALRKSSFLGYKHEYLMREDWELFIRYYLAGLKIKLLDNSKVLIREHTGRTSRNIRFMKATVKVYEDYKELIPKEYLPDFTMHTALTCMRFGALFKGWSLWFRAVYQKPSLLSNPRNFLYALKWGFRFERFFKSILPTRERL